MLDERPSSDLSDVSALLGLFQRPSNAGMPARRIATNETAELEQSGPCYTRGTPLGYIFNVEMGI